MLRPTAHLLGQALAAVVRQAHRAIQGQADSAVTVGLQASVATRVLADSLVTRESADSLATAERAASVATLDTLASLDSLDSVRRAVNAGWVPHTATPH